jgi:hypothetical protein
MKLPATRCRLLIVLLLLSSLLFAAPRPGYAQSLDIPTEDLLVWLDAGDPDADGNPNNNPANGAEVNPWKDRSGNGKDAQRYSSIGGGAYTRDVVNGLPALRFQRQSGLSPAYEIDLFLSSADHPKVTILTVYRIAEHASDLGLWGNYERVFYTHTSSGDGYINTGNWSNNPPIIGSGTPDIWRLSAVTYNGFNDGSSNSGPVDGSSVYLDGELMFTFTDTTDDSVMDSWFGIGFDGTSGEEYFNGDIAEFIIYDRVLSDDELQDIFWTMGQKYAEDWGGTAPPEEPTPVLPSGPQCFSDVDMAVSPQFISLAPGGEATVNVAVRNTNNELQGYNDLLVSFSDGLDVVSVSDGGVDLGQRAAWQKFQLEANETREFAVTVRANEQLTAAPLHITELYCGGRVLERIDGVFITPAPAAAPAVVAVEPTPAPAGAPAPLPVVLPNTAGETAAVDPSLAIWPLLILLTAWLLRQRRRA